jgi:dTDP-4-dehydrorhamnose 3,5-epimerase
MVLEPRVFSDPRGYFVETWQRNRYSEIGMPDFVQDNVSWSRKGVLRGMHLQNPMAQGKLVSVAEGAVYDVAVDLRKGSPTFGKWHGETLDSKLGRQFYVPPGFAHGFVVLSDFAVFAYKCSDYYNPTGEFTVRWDDPEIGIEWPVDAPIVSEKDAQGMRLGEIPDEKLLSFA